MALFKPNLPCVITKSSGYDGYGQPVPGTEYNERCAIISLVVGEKKTSIRADSTASRGAAEEYAVDSKLLLTKDTVADIDDLILVSGITLQITSRFPRHNLRGVLDHYEVTAAAASTS